MQHTGIQYTLQYLEIEGDVCHDQYPMVHLFLIYFFKSFLFACQMTQNLFKLVRKNPQGAELKQITFFSQNNRALDFYWLKVEKTQQQGGWMGDV